MHEKNRKHATIRRRPHWIRGNLDSSEGNQLKTREQ